MQPDYTVNQETVQLSRSHPIRVRDVRLGASRIPPHDHEFCEVVMVSSGRAAHRTIDGERDLRAGDFLILQPGQVHGYERISGLRVLNVYYLDEWILRSMDIIRHRPRMGLLFLGNTLFPRRTGSKPVHVRLDAESTKTAMAELGELEMLSGEPDPDPLLMLSILLKCFVLWNLAIGTDANLNENVCRHPAVGIVMEGIEKCLFDGRRMALEEWAAQAGWSTDHLSRRFREQTGESPRACFQRRRLHHAAHDLIHSSDSLSEIAHRLGYSDSAHFSRAFRDHFAMPPKTYRKRFHG